MHTYCIQCSENYSDHKYMLSMYKNTIKKYDFSEKLFELKLHLLFINYFILWVKCMIF